jgi:ABC-type nitrate/sulfonate/bicarbonate transport system substrate-binding protein
MPDPVSPDLAVPDAAVPDAAVPDAGTVALVRGLLTAAGLSPADDEIAYLATAYPRMRGAADRLQAIVSDTDPAPVFDPVPLFASGSTAGAGRVTEAVTGTGHE